MIKKLVLFILLISFVTEIFSDDVDQSKDDSKKHSFELFIRFNRGPSWLPESIRRKSDANSSLGHSANYGIFTSYDPPSRDRKFENPDFKSFGFVYKNNFYKLMLDYNYLSFSQYFKVNYSYAGIFPGEDHPFFGSGFLYNIHPLRTENKFALTKEIFNNDRFVFRIGGGARFLSITQKQQYPIFIPEYVQLISSVSTFSDVTKTYGPQVSVRSELRLFRGLSFRTNLDVFFLQGISKSNFEYFNTNEFISSKAVNKIQFHGLDLNTEISLFLFNHLRLFIGYELILSKAKFLQFNESNNSFDFYTSVSSELKKHEYTQNKSDSLNLFYFGTGFIF
ncbi:LA_2444/LA_4059 family outer membrane protein [Leptospira borgpetersenii]|uniref:LA_2444/LA_4059 family outer membrane protein n=1 Tax=Leptospira borgpetersenii TaxID=174 RepID=UPI000774764B|nr:LA_2444/LA_4059 family outer membrane protein [Leptospira borgpetersenii]